MSAKFENLAANGIIDFDANAFVYGGKQVPATHEEEPYMPFDKPLMASPNVPVMMPGVTMHQQPHRDQFGNEKKITPKEALTAVILAGLGVFGLIKGVPMVKDLVENISNKISKNKKKAQKAEKEAKAKKIADEAKAAEKTKNAKATNTLTKGWKNLTEKIAKLPKWSKFVGGAGIALVAFFGIKKLFSKNKTHGE